MKVLFRMFLPVFALLILSGTLAGQSAVCYGLARNSSPSASVYLATVNPTNGVVSNISPISLSSLINLTGAALNPYDSTFHYLTVNEVLSVDLNTGLLLSTAPLTNPIAPSYFDNFRFNNSDEMLYGLARRSYFDTLTQQITGELYLATLDPPSGLITQISPASVGQYYGMAGSAIDPYQMVYYYSTGSHLVGLDLYSGMVYSNTPITISNALAFDNFAYNCSDTTLYGLVRQIHWDSVPNPLYPNGWYVFIDSVSMKLGKIVPSTGLVTTISPVSLGVASYSLNAGATVDPSALIYYFSDGANLIGVSLQTGLKVSQQLLNNVNGQFFDLMRIHSDCYTATEPVRPNPLLHVSEAEKSGVIHLWPNPAGEYCRIEAAKPVSHAVLCDLEGRVLKTVSPGERQFNLGLDGLSPGVYVFIAWSDGRPYYHKLVKR